MKNIVMKIAGILALALVGHGSAVPRGEVRAAQSVLVKLGTLAPTGSLYHTALIEMGQKWRDATGGAVKLNIYPDGTQGGEANMVRMMRAGILTAGMLTIVGLEDIEPSVAGLSSLPMVFRTWDEYDYVVGKLAPRLEKMMMDKGFVVLFWADAGFVRFFSKIPGQHPNDFKQMKMFTWAGNAFQVDLMKSLGYNPVPLETADILPGLRTGLITAIPIPSSQALAGQIYMAAPNMLDLKWAVLSGAAIVRKNVWDKIAPEAQDKLLEAADVAGQKLRAASRKEDEDAIEAMKNKGLKVNPATSQIEDEWHKLTKVLYPQIRGKMVPEDIFDEVLRLVEEYRANSKIAEK